MAADVPDPDVSPDPLDAIRLERSSTLDQVVEGLRNAILGGELAPGTPLREVDLADRLGVSRGTVREALRLLAPHGLVEHRVHRGASVAHLDPDDVADAYRARRVVECAAAELAARGADLGPMRRALERMEAAAADEQVAEFVDAHAAFHDALVAVLDSPRLTRFVRGVQGELRLGFAVLDRLAGDLGDSVDDHWRLLGVLDAGDPSAARAALIAHLTHGAEDVADLAAADPDGVAG